MTPDAKRQIYLNKYILHLYSLHVSLRLSRSDFLLPPGVQKKMHNVVVSTETVGRSFYITE